MEARDARAYGQGAWAVARWRVQATAEVRPGSAVGGLARCNEIVEKRMPALDRLLTQAGLKLLSGLRPGKIAPMKAFL